MSRVSSPLRDRMIFLVGARRSGTNWLQRVLCARPDVAAVPSETYLFSHGIAPLIERFQHAAPSSPSTGTVYMDREVMLDALRDLCDAVFEGVRSIVAPRAERLVERTPDHVRHLSLIAEVYPDARVVHIIRDGRDVARSLLSQDWGPDTIGDAAEEWRSAIASARSAAPALRHYREVRYEEVLAAPHARLTEVFSWLGLDASQAVVESALLEAGVPFNVDAAAPGIGAGKWRDSLSRDDVARFMGIAGGTLAELGYADLADAGTSGARRSTAGAPAGSPEPERSSAFSSLRKNLGRKNLGRKNLVRIRGAGRRSSKAAAAQKEILARATQAQSVMDRLLSCLALRRFEELSGMLTPDALVRVVGEGATVEVRGAAGRDRLIETLTADPALKGRVVRSDIHPSVPSPTAVTSYLLPDGTTAERVVVATVRGESITRLTYYRLPLGAGSDRDDR